MKHCTKVQNWNFPTSAGTAAAGWLCTNTDSQLHILVVLPPPAQAGIAWYATPHAPGRVLAVARECVSKLPLQCRLLTRDDNQLQVQQRGHHPQQQPGAVGSQGDAQRGHRAAHVPVESSVEEAAGSEQLVGECKQKSRLLSCQPQQQLMSLGSAFLTLGCV